MYYGWENFVYTTAVQNFRSLIYDRCTMAGENFVYTTAVQNFRSRIYDNYTMAGKIFFYYRGLEFPAIETATVALWRDI